MNLFKGIFILFLTVFLIGSLVSISISFTIYIFSYYLKIDNTVKRIVTEKDLTQAKEWHDKGYQYFLDNEDDKAIEDYNKAIELDPNYALAYIDRGFIYYNKG